MTSPLGVSSKQGFVHLRGKGMAWMALVCLRSPESFPFPSELVVHPNPTHVSPDPCSAAQLPLLQSLLPPPPTGWEEGKKGK